MKIEVKKSWMSATALLVLAAAVIGYLAVQLLSMLGVGAGHGAVIGPGDDIQRALLHHHVLNEQHGPYEIYLGLVLFLLAFIVKNMFQEKDLLLQIDAALVIVPLVLRLLLVK